MRNPPVGPGTGQKRKLTRFKKDPHVWGLLCGVATATAVLVYAAYRQWPHAVVLQPSVILGVLIAFVVGYGLAGVCAYLLVQTLRREQRARELARIEAAMARKASAERKAAEE